ncbi:MAG TPA: hypothetical protein VMO52_01085 [Acidimicrobiia bacterium]|nr:hypothetical protein [Acidimicrobiia bacterium]
MKTRRALAVCLATVLALVLMVPAVLAGTEVAEDSFDAISYSHGSGWTRDWTETGEATNPSAGVIQVVSSGCSSNCVRFSTILTLGDYGVSRTTDISGAETATLSFTYKQEGVGLLELWTRSGPTASWTKRSLDGGTGGFTAASFDITADAGAATEVRFNMSLLSLTASAHIDDVLITASYPTTTTSTTTTTTEPILNLPTVTVPSLLTTTTSGGTGTRTTTTTTAGGTGTSTTTSTAPPGAGGGGSDSPPGGGSSGDGDQATVNPPLTEGELDFAAESNIVVNLAGEGDFGGFEPGIDINPMTDLWVKLNTTVEAISTEILSALGLGAMIAFFAVRRISDDDPIAASVELRS